MVTCRRGQRGLRIKLPARRGNERGFMGGAKISGSKIDCKSDYRE